MIVTVHATPRSRQEKVEWLDEDTCKVWVRAVAEGGKANDAIVRILADELKVAKSLITLRRGGSARMKQFDIEKHPD